MFASAVSRWTPLYFAVALGSFVLAQILMAAGLMFRSVSLSAPATLGSRPAFPSVSTTMQWGWASSFPARSGIYSAGSPSSA